MKFIKLNNGALVNLDKILDIEYPALVSFSPERYDTEMIRYYKSEDNYCSEIFGTEREAIERMKQLEKILGVIDESN